ncbi:MAG: UDP-N-acetylmuramoyl-L-alanine--D-glutamate ligase [Clostridia bacterium]|nr:UDP-N-acetylmuramoyl-L-alanine--D-glutamate ligase [Clostridia bacterium]
MDFKNKKVLVSGTAKSGISAAYLLKKLGANVIIQDLKTEDKLGEIVDELKKAGFELYLGANPDDIIENTDILVMSPGVPVDLPFVNRAKEKNIPVIGEIELAYMFCKAPIIAITGTNGKTTTTSLVGDICKAYFENAFVVGNIGNPFADITLETKEKGIVAAELSSFQLETINEFKPKVSAVLNITPDHLNRHHSLENYIKAKERVFENQDENDFCILNHNDETTLKMADKAKAKVIFFSLNNKLEEGIYSDEKSIYINALGYNEKVVDIDELKILGGHNVENAMAAIGCCIAAGVPMETVRKVLREFKAVEHRIEYVATINNIEFYNDSKGTNPDASIKAVEAMKRPICIIAGGYDKGSDFTEWIDTFKGRVKFAAVIGAVKNQIADTLDKAGFNNYKLAETFEEAIDLCYENAEEGDCVLLSPACASWDMFKSYEQRGEIFKEYVNKTLINRKNS